MDYLQERENWKLALHRYSNFEKVMCERLGCNLYGLEAALLEGRKRPEVAAMASEYGRLAHELDAAADRWDAVQLYQSRRTAAATAQLNRDLQRLEC